MAEDINCIKVWHQCIFLQIKWLFMLILWYKIFFSHQHLWLMLAVMRVRAEAPQPFSLLPETQCLCVTRLKNAAICSGHSLITEVPKKGDAEIKIFELVKKYGLTERTYNWVQGETFCITTPVGPVIFLLSLAFLWQLHLFNTQLPALLVLDYDTSLWCIIIS